MKNSPTHPQVQLPTPMGLISCDEDIASLVTEFWRLGIETQFSCQGAKVTRRRTRFGERAYILSYENQAMRQVVNALSEKSSLFATAYDHEWSQDEDELLPTRVVKRNYFGIERDRYHAVDPRVCLRFPSWAIPELKDFLQELQP